MLSAEQRKAVREGGRAQRAELAPPSPASPELLNTEREIELRRREYDRVSEFIQMLNKEFGVGGGDMDLRGRRFSHAV